jgi:hypothetical protein
MVGLSSPPAKNWWRKLLTVEGRQQAIFDTIAFVVDSARGKPNNYKKLFFFMGRC